MKNFSDMVTQSVFARLLSLIVLALVLIAAIIIASVDLLNGHEVPGIVQNILWVGIGTAGTMIGVNFGVVLQPAPAPVPAPAPAPTTTAAPIGVSSNG